MGTKSERPEQLFRAWYCRKWEKVGGFAQPIESRATGLGIPDGYFITPIEHRGFWAEFKVMKEIDTAIPFEPGQLNWLCRHMLYGGVSLVIVKCEPYIYVFSAEYVNRETQCIRTPNACSRYILRESLKSLDGDAIDRFVERLDTLVRDAVRRPSEMLSV